MIAYIGFTSFSKIPLGLLSLPDLTFISPCGKIFLMPEGTERSVGLDQPFDYACSLTARTHIVVAKARKLA